MRISDWSSDVCSSDLPVLNSIVAAHSYPPVAEKLLAEALVLTVLLGSTLKDPESQLTLQAQTGGGPVELLVCDYRRGELRGYLRFDAERLAAAGSDPTLFALFGRSEEHTSELQSLMR